MAEKPLSTARRTLSGAGWLIGSRLLTRAIDFAALLALARVLTPADFGVIAIGMTLVQVVEAVLELPVGQVLVRSASLTPALLSTAFTLGLTRGVLLTAVLIAVAYPASLVYHDQRLVSLIAFLSLAPALRSAVSPRMIVFAREIDFRREVALDLISKAAALTFSAGTAYVTRSYWAIAIGTVLTPLVLMLGSYLLAPYRPRLTLSEWRIFASFLGWNTAAQALTAINWQSDRPILGLFVPPALLGTYSVANDLSLLPEQALVKPVYRPLLSGYVTVLDDKPRLGQAHLRAAHLLVAAGTPMMVGLAFLATPATRLVLGGKWLLAAPIVQWLALALIIPIFTAALGPLAVALGKTEVFFRQSLIELALRLPLTALLVWRFGLAGMVLARFMTSLLNTGTSIYYVRKLIGVSARRQLLIGWRPLLAGSVMGTALLGLRPFLVTLTGLDLAVGLMVCGATGLTAYVSVTAALWLASGRPETFEGAVFNAAVRLARAAPSVFRPASR